MLAARVFVWACVGLLGAVTYAMVGLTHPPEPAYFIAKLRQEMPWPWGYRRVHPEVYEALKYGKDGYVRVIIKLMPVHREKRDPRERDAAVKEIQDRVLSKLSADEFRLICRFPTTAALDGVINAAGLAKLADDPDVVSTRLARIYRPMTPIRTKPG